MVEPEIPTPPNRDRNVERYWENIYFRRDWLGTRDLDEGKKDNIKSAKSEDAVTWNVLVGLLDEAGTIQVPTVLPAKQTLDLTMSGARLFLWNAPVGGADPFCQVQQKLVATMKRCEANQNSTSEIDAVLFDTQARRLTLVESKLTSGPGICQAVRTEQRDVFDLTRGRKKKAECRLYRESKKPRDNGCSYWGDGRGGAAFTGRFPTDLVAKHLGFERPIEGREHEAPCAIYYQLMRNVIIGRELAAEIGAHFTMLAIVADGYYDRRYYERFLAAMSKDRREELDFKVVTWQDIGRALPAKSRVRQYIQRHDRLGL